MQIETHTGRRCRSAAARSSPFPWSKEKHDDLTARWFGSPGSERVVVEFDEVEATLTPELAVGHAFVTYRAISAEGAELRALTNRLTLATQRGASGWKIIHEHSSAPIDHRSTKAIFAR